MADVLLDSDVIIEFLRGTPAVIDELAALEAAGGTISYTPIAKAEIYHGLRKGEEKAAEAFFAGCRSLPVTDAVGEKAGRYLAQYHRSHGLALGDAIVAAAAHVYRSPLFTLNLRHYPMKDITLHRPLPPREH